MVNISSCCQWGHCSGWLRLQHCLLHISILNWWIRMSEQPVCHCVSRLPWQHLPCMSLWMRARSWMQRRPLCRCHSLTFSGFLSTCFPKSSAALYRWVWFLLFFFFFFLSCLFRRFCWVCWFCVSGQCLTEANPGFPKSWWAGSRFSRQEEHSHRCLFLHFWFQCTCFTQTLHSGEI